MRRAARGLAAAAILLLSPGAAPALECAAPERADPRLTSVPAEARIAWLRARLDDGRPGALAWSWTWGVVDGALTVGQLAAIPTTSEIPAKGVLAVGAASSALGVVQVVALPIVPAAASETGGGCAELERLEASLERSARNVQLGSGWPAQLGNLAINAAIGIAAGYADRRWQTGALTFGIGWMLGEAQILTMPTAYVRDLERYRAADLGDAPGGARAPRLAAAGGVRGRGVALSVVARF
jgi:hypothetical protein